MTEEQIKENISRNFVQLIAGRSGYKCAKPESDHGCDLTVTFAVPHNRDGRVRWLDSGRYLDIQLKCTTEDSVEVSPVSLKYDLDAKTYNDLIARRDGTVPLFLIVLVLPSEPNDWITVTDDELVVRRRAYWFLPDVNATETANVSSVRIVIPAANRMTTSFFAERFSEVYS